MSQYNGCACPICNPNPMHGYGCEPCYSEAPVTTCACALTVNDTSSIDLSLSGSGNSASPWILEGKIKIDSSSPSPIVVTENGLSVGCCQEHQQNLETVTSLVDNGNGTFTYVNENNVATTVNYCCNDTVTTLTDSGSSFTYVNEAGASVTVNYETDIPDDVVTTLVPNTDGTFTYTSENGTQTVISFTSTSNTDTTYDLIQTGESITLSDSNGSTDTVNICDIVEQFCPETTTSLTFNNTSFTYVNEDGVSITVPFPASTGSSNIVDNGDGTYTYTSSDGTQVVINTNNADSNTTYVLTEAVNDGFVTLFGSDGSASSVDICKLIEDHCDVSGSETVTTLVDNGNNTFTYTSEDGTQTLLTFSGGTSDTNTIYDLTYIGGSVIQLSGSDGSTDQIDLCSIVEGNCSDNLVNNGNGTFTHTAVNNIVTTIDVCAAVQAGGCIPSLVLNNDGTYTFNNGYGGITNIVVSGGGTGATYDLIDNGNNSISLVGSNGTVDTVDVCCTTAATLTGTVLTMAQSNGTSISVDLTALQSEECCNTALTLDSNTGVLTLTQSNGQTLTATIPPGTVNTVECCNTGATLTGNVLEITQSNGAPVSVDFSAILDDECCIQTTLCDPAGSEVIRVKDLNTGTFSHYDALTLDPWTGDPNTLVACPSGGSGGTECCNTGMVLSLSGSVITGTITQSNGATITDTVDLSSLSGGTTGCITYADNANALPPLNYPDNLVAPASVDKWCELRIDNGPTGCEIWRRLEAVDGTPQWHQTA